MKDNKVIKLKFSTAIFIAIAIILIIIATVIFCLFKNNNASGTTIKIRYAYAYNVATADALNEIHEQKYIDILEIDLEGDELERVTELLNKTSFEEVDTIKLAVIDEYEVIINENEKIAICPGENYAYYSKDDEGFIIKISKELVNEIDKIVQKRVNEKLEKFSSEKITISVKDKENVNITDKEDVQKLTENLKYIRVNIEKEEMENEEVKYIVNLDNRMQVYVYYASCIGYIVNDKEEYYVAFITDYENIVETIYENNK